MANSGAAASDVPERIHLEHLLVVDLRGLTQSEILNLSRCTATTFPCDDVVTPTIDRTVFNESAASHRQTYSHYRFAATADSSQPPLRRRALRHGRGVPHHSLDTEQEEKGENENIVSGLLKDLFEVPVESNAIINDYHELVPVRVVYSPTEPLIAEKIASTVPIPVVPFGLSNSALQSGELVSVRVEYSPTEPLIAEKIASTVPVPVEPFGVPDPALHSGNIAGLTWGVKQKRTTARGRPAKH